MGYHEKPTVITKVKDELNKILNINKTNGLVILQSKSPMTLAYDLRQAIKMAAKFHKEPYDKLHGKVRVRIMGITVVVEDKGFEAPLEEKKILASFASSLSELIGKFIVHKDEYDGMMFKETVLESSEIEKLTNVVNNFGFNVTNTNPITLEKK